MVITRQGQTITLPDLFLEEGFIFGRENIAFLLVLTKTTQEEFADKYGFSRNQLKSWMREKRQRNPNAGARVSLAFVAKRFGRRLKFE